MKKILLAILSLGSATFANAQCNELFISEVVEGSGNNKAIEIYNPTPNPIALSNYRILRFSNGSTTVSDSLTLTGTIAPHDVWVVVNGQTTSSSSSPACDPALQAMADQLAGGYPDPLYQNGNDALVLAKISPRTFVDIYGKIGEDPGAGWSDVFPYTAAQGTWWTIDHTLVRKSTVTQGVTTNPSAFNVTAEWDSLPKNTWTNLGMHNSVCITSAVHEIANNYAVKAFPNPSNGTFTISAAMGISSVEVFNALGEVVLTDYFADNNSQQQIDLSGKAEGLYIVQVNLANGRKILSKVSIR
ncbi:MAG: lamin tail domain-containing protein [Bacteroidia bacterium]